MRSAQAQFENRTDPQCRIRRLCRGVFTLTELFDDECEVEESEEQNVEFLEAGEDSTEAFEAAEQSLDLVALLVESSALPDLLYQ